MRGKSGKTFVPFVRLLCVLFILFATVYLHGINWEFLCVLSQLDKLNDARNICALARTAVLAHSQ